MEGSKGTRMLNEYLKSVARNQKQNPKWRRGQALFNTLCDFDSVLAKEITGTGLDPFYFDKREVAFISHITQVWDNE